MTLLNTAISGLITSQRGLATVGHNIANAGTDGYSRQRIEQSARVPQFTGSGYVGTGSEVTAIERIHSQFITDQVRISTSSASENQTLFLLASRLDGILADEETGLGQNLSAFFNAVQDVADLPSAIPNRQVMISEAESLSSRFQFIDSRISDLTNEVRLQVTEDVTEINNLSNSIADLNQRIVDSTGNFELAPPNDLLDQRDELVRQLAGLVSVTTVEQSDGAMNVFTGNGQALVLGIDASTIAVSETYFGHFDVTLTTTFSSSIITDNISGGSIGALLDYQSQILEPTRNSLGRLAIGLAETFNAQHRLGRSLDGDVNQAFFTVGAPDVIPLGTAPNNVTATITDPNALSNSDYNLTYNGGNSYTLIRLIDGQTTAINTGGVSPYTTPVVDGFTMTITAGATAGDEFIVRPTINGARDIDNAITDTRKIAAAGPLRGAEGTDVNGLPNNTGTATISDVNITSATGIPLATPITLTFNSALNQFAISAPPGGTLAYNPATDSAGVQFTIAAAGNATFTIAGVPDNGDTFTITNNTNADGDNRNALSLANLQTTKNMLNNTANYQETYGILVVDVGTITRQTQISEQAITALLDQAIESRESIAGVNLDEEAADLLRYQQAYQAAAQMIATADRLFQTLIESF